MDNPFMTVERVHLIFKTHLDVGFTDYAKNVVRSYFEGFIPQAISTAHSLRERGGSERFIWTTGSWLIYEYLEKESLENRALLEAAITAGDITWHGLPFTLHSELSDPSLYRFGLNLSRRLDRRYGKTTIAGKMTDVPGHTRGIVPLLAEAGIKFLHIGVNQASTPPDVPDVFVWRDEASNTDVIVMYHKGSYGATMTIPGLPDAIAFAHTNDNIGPQTAEQVLENYEQIRAQFPNAQVFASTLDSFASALLPIKDQLPVITAELGDTWIHGGGSDPKKISQFRELLRFRRDREADPLLDEFNRSLLMIPEHTWGMDIKTHLKDYEHFSAAQFRSARALPNFQAVEQSWQEQRNYIHEAITALGPLADDARTQIQTLTPIRPDTTGFQTLDPLTLETPYFHVGLDSATGAINKLVYRDQRWADASHLLGQFRYETFSTSDYDRFYRQYNINHAETRHWSVDDYTKPGMEVAGKTYKSWIAQLKQVYWRQAPDGQHVILELATPEESYVEYGCPKTLIMELFFPNLEPAIHFTFQWFDKSACRLPEALWLSFVPRSSDAKLWKMDKLGTLISPLEVIRDGNRHLHGITSGVYYGDDLALESLDAALVAPGEPALLMFTNRQPALNKGMHFNLFNNVWGTNFPMWYEDDARFRFVLRFKK
jgi:hypothetical protein